jgi:hypothetical protein
MDNTVGRGGTITLRVRYSDGTGSAVDPTTPFVDVTDADGTMLVSGATPSQVAVDGTPIVGLYEYAYTVAVDAPLGTWLATFGGIINGVSVSDGTAFTVRTAGSVSEDFVRLATADELAARMGEVFTGMRLAQAEAALDDASATVRAEAALTPEWTSSNAPPMAKTIVLAVARRLLVNPDRLTSQKIGSYAEGQSASSATGVILTSHERIAVARASGRTGVQSVRVYRPGLAQGELPNTVEFDVQLGVW